MSHQHTHELPISVAGPLQEAAHGGPMHLGEGHSAHSSEKGDNEKRPYPVTDDVEAAPSEELEDLYPDDDEPGKFTEKWNAFRASKTATIMRDFLLIGLLVRPGSVVVVEGQVLTLHSSVSGSHRS